jgi:hypothetical protein
MWTDSQFPAETFVLRRLRRRKQHNRNEKKTMTSISPQAFEQLNAHLRTQEETIFRSHRSLRVSFVHCDSVC